MTHRMIILACCLTAGGFAAELCADWDEPPALNFQVKTLAGEPADLNDYQGDVLLIVNVASKCGLTPQYRGLQKLHEKYADNGLRVMGFPCNQFGGQEPGTAKEIQQFCSDNYDVTFDMFEKVDVNGSDACNLYRHLTSLTVPPAGTGDISWNFEKFVVGRNGEVVARFSPRTAPDDPQLIETIERELEATPAP